MERLIQQYFNPAPCQGGIFQWRQGTRLPRNLQAPTKFLQQFVLFWCKFDLNLFPYFLLDGGILHITQKETSGLCSNYLPQKEIFYHRKESLIKGNNFLSKAVISCCRKKFLVTEQFFCQWKKFLVIGGNFVSEAELSCHRKKFLGIR